MRSCRRNKTLALRVLAVLLTFMVLQSFGMGLWDSRYLQAQQPPQDTIIATTLFDTRFDGPPPGPATISIATITLVPGQATLPLVGHGSLMMLVQSGTVTLLVDHAIDGLPLANSSDNASEPRFVYRLRAGQRVTIPSIETIQFRNEGDETSSLLMLTLVSEGGASLPEVTANS